MKISKMMIHYTLMFTVPTAVAFYYYNPQSDDDIRKAVEAKVKPDAERRRKNHSKFAELLLQRGDVSQETQKQLDDVTSFTKRD
ncbi:hypothetical protein PybrP1_012214 [[Pythium] brassicae (nom. inval.)]|nr:hypothetical protein PybrP1_012214 [[Pythium] brassicae (nom. inval.)]